MEHVAILLAGGNGSRMGNACEDKILLEINGQAVFAHVLRAFVGSGTQDGLVVVARDHAQEQQLAAMFSTAC
ncbi:MAG: NTP transferase domain-containing protein, partial [Oceanipulchritudo sp.]